MTSRVTRRALLLAGGAAGLGLLDARPWGASAAAPPAPPAEGGVAPVVTVPPLTENGSKVPVTVAMTHPMEPDHHVTSVRVVNDRDPIPSKGEFHFTAANGHVYVAFQARLDDGLSSVRADAACSRGQRWSGTGEVRVASGGGGCAGLPPARSDERAIDIRPPVIRLPQLLRGRPLDPGQLVDVQVKFKHPVRTGLGLREGRFVPVAEPFYLTEMDVLYRGAHVSRFAMTPALADDPLITFRLRPVDEGLLRVVFRNSRGAEFDATQPIRFGS